MDLSDYETEKLLQHYGNAYVTYCRAIGHGKSYRNEVRYQAIEKVLKQRGFTAEQLKEARAAGTFNGDGHA